MIWAGSPYAQRIEFSTGTPVGAISYQLFDNDGALLVSNSITPAEDAVSCLVIIGGEHHTCGKPLFENRTLSWNYTTVDDLVSGRVTYRVQRPIPFAASTEGVRLKLGVEQHELHDAEIDLVSAYAEFIALFVDGVLAVHETAGDRSTILCIHAIEAFAALTVLPSLQVKIAQRETSGTNEYQRFTKIDWDRIDMDLRGHIDRARSAVDDSFDPIATETFSFGKISRDDGFTGS